eukprot:CAMPEP_0198323566 /NCGR_PEP_ID=MMETSP1450-20131203/11775_1 /TAXON_ID=753684 ORGANISM="Madagascaria erythrocladiodes, Strain CCMP3234" /NCGR_SAMPLE_ID=MMETSP1450 /ASSEMBLY_ACC=CAM_ASM_001115 /LENGTH=211 /DNA_ID=CAMNT_0044027283 /DNA_START=66 /DNA_END=701 /DNA_ORIENTATION=-
MAEVVAAQAPRRLPVAQVPAKRGRRPRNPELTDEQRRLERSIKNRESAKRSRLREKAREREVAERLRVSQNERQRLRDDVAALRSRLQYLEACLQREGTRPGYSPYSPAAGASAKARTPAPHDDDTATTNTSSGSDEPALQGASNGVGAAEVVRVPFYGLVGQHNPHHVPVAHVMPRAGMAHHTQHPADAGQPQVMLMANDNRALSMYFVV